MRKTINLGKVGVDLTCQWAQFINPEQWNWITFDFIQLTFENDRFIGTSEIELYLLGFGIRIYWISNEEVADAKLKKWAKQIRKAKKKVKK